MLSQIVRNELPRDALSYPRKTEMCGLYFTLSTLCGMQVILTQGNSNNNNNNNNNNKVYFIHNTG